jgi:hypothetical protein
MKAVSAILVGILVLAAGAPADAQTGYTPSTGAGVQARQRVDLQVPVPGEIQRLTLSDGSEIFGRVESIGADSIVFKSIAGAAMTVPQSNIADLRIVKGTLVEGEFLPEDSHNTRLMFSPTARSLRRGEGYVGFYYIFPFVQVGVTDRFSLGAGTPLIFSGGTRPVWFTPKLQVIAREKVQVAAGVIHITGFDDFNAGIGYGVTTFGSDSNSATVGLGYAYIGDNRAPILMVGGEHRASRRIKFITENWLWRGGGRGFVSGGVRFLGERLSADASLVVPLVEGAVVFPVLSFAWRF